MRKMLMSLLFLVAGTGMTVGCGDSGGASTAPAAAPEAEAAAEPAAEGSGARAESAPEEGSGDAE